jgi:hypothetical protein
MEGNVRRFVPAKLHGELDFLTVGLFLTGPRDLFGVKDAPASTIPARVMGPGVVISSMLTDYGSDNGFASARVIPMKTHLLLDALLAVPTGLAPWISGSWRKGFWYWAPQTFAMASELFFALTTELEPD